MNPAPSLYLNYLKGVGTIGMDKREGA